MIVIQQNIEKKITQEGIWDFTDGIESHNHITCVLPYDRKKGESIEKLHVCMNLFGQYTYIGTNYFYVRLQIYYDDGKRFFYTTGIISQKGFFIQNDVVEVIVRYCLPIVDFIPMDKNQYGNNEKSKLAMYGYNARKNELSEIQRRRIIDFVLKHGFMSKTDIVNLLEHNIQYCHKYNAIKIWKNDIEYIRSKAK